MLYLFDIDGTLLLSGGAGARALEGAFAARFGLAGAMDGVQLGGKTDPNIVEEVFLARFWIPYPRIAHTALVAYLGFVNLAYGQHLGHPTF